MPKRLCAPWGWNSAVRGILPGARRLSKKLSARWASAKTAIRYADGSGLSRLNLISADALVRILKYMHRHPHFRCFYDALAIAGVDGTLATRMKRTKAENNVHAKTGTFANASALSGYVQTADGEMLAFSILANNYVASKDAAEYAQDKALARLAGFSRKGKNQSRRTAGSVG